MIQFIKKMRGHIFYFLVDIFIPLYVKIRQKKKKTWDCKASDLLEYPSNSLGQTLGLFLQKNKMQLMPQTEEHDVFHLLLDLDTSVKDEIRMQFFLFGNGKTTLSVLGTLVVGILMPEAWKTFLKDFKRGTQSNAIHNLDYEKLLKTPFIEVKGWLIKTPVLNQWERPNRFSKPVRSN